MREIKFRAWNGKRMLFSENGDFYLMPNNMISIPSSTGHEFYNKNYPIMQFTGLKDENGVDIYEGDIISWTWYRIGQGGGTFTSDVVTWNSSGKWGLGKGRYYEFNPTLCSVSKIIGNRFENPELLEAS